MSDTVRDQLLEACLAMGAAGLGGYIGGHVSIRVPGEERLWLNSLDQSFEETTRDDLTLMDFDGRILDGRRASNGVGFHAGIYRARPDIGAIVHTHGRWIVAQSAFQRPPRVYHNLASLFHDRVGLSRDGSSANCVAALGTINHTIVMPWHGAVTTGTDVGEACAMHETLDLACWLDVHMTPAGAEPMADTDSEALREYLLKGEYLALTWALQKRRIGSPPAATPTLMEYRLSASSERAAAA